MAMRISLAEKQRAIHIAKNSKDSKFGNTLLHQNVQETRLLDKRLAKLEKERRRQTMHVDQRKKCFVEQRNTAPGPLLIVERPPSPDLLHKIIMIENNEDTLDVPGYMRPLKTRVKTPSNHITIEAFAVKAKKKVNVWESVLNTSDPPRFQSAGVPSFPLTVSENSDLWREWQFHVPRPRRNPEQNNKRSYSDKYDTPIDANHRLEMVNKERTNADTNSATFITQIHREPTQGSRTKEHVNHVVTFNTPTSKVGRKRQPLATDTLYTNVKQSTGTTTATRDYRDSTRAWLKTSYTILL